MTKELLEIFSMVHKSCHPQLESTLTGLLSHLRDLQVITGRDYILTLKDPNYLTQEQIDQYVAADPDGVVNKKSRW